ncbi:MAG TPA: glycosyltransferase family 2 protein, partial [Rhodocyclaceae bacterium]|nr:glycosyltransferase family 2 protein [Rhodocyclaceae bacterium]
DLPAFRAPSWMQPSGLMRNSARTRLSLVVPVYNEAESIALFLDAIHRIFASQTGLDVELVFVNDGSQDDTLDRLLESQGKDARIKIVDLSRNFGKEAALSAGLQVATGEVIVPIDVDLQDPPELIPAMLEKWREGYEAPHYPQVAAVP